MKKIALLILSLGVAISSQAQGYFNFNNDVAYTGAANPQLITVGAQGAAGQGAVGTVIGSGGAPNYSIGFLWADGTSFNDANAFQGIGANGGVSASFLSTSGDIVGGAGIFDAGKAILNGTVDGQNITVQAIAWFNPNGTTTFAAAKAAGNQNVGWSSLMTVRLAAGADNIVGDLGGMQGFTVQAVPEPTIFALGGIGAAALMIIRRRK